MKTKLVIVFLLLGLGIIARLPSTFLGWNRLAAESPDILVVYAGDPTPPNSGIVFENGPSFDFRIKVLSVLKGTNSVGNSRLCADHELKPGETYLFFGFCSHGVFNAYGDFSVVPLGKAYSQEMIAGKPLDEQVHILFQLAVDHINSEIAQKQTEKARLETALKK